MLFRSPTPPAAPAWSPLPLLWGSWAELCWWRGPQATSDLLLLHGLHHALPEPSAVGLREPLSQVSCSSMGLVWFCRLGGLGWGFFQFFSFFFLIKPSSTPCRHQGGGEPTLAHHTTVTPIQPPWPSSSHHGTRPTTTAPIPPPRHLSHHHGTHLPAPSRRCQGLYFENQTHSPPAASWRWQPISCPASNKVR